MPVALVWLSGVTVLRRRVTQQDGRRVKKRVHLSATFSLYVLECLQSLQQNSGSCRRPWFSPALHGAHSEWYSQVRHLERKIFGLALVRGLFETNPATYLTAQQREVHRYWTDILGHSDVPVFFFEVLEFIPLAQPYAPFVETAPFNLSTSACDSRPAARTLIHAVSKASASAMWQARAHGTDRSIADVCSSWAERHKLVTGVSFQTSPKLTFSVPVPHLLLMTMRLWRTHGFPLPAGTTQNDTDTRRWVGCERLRQLVGPRDLTSSMGGGLVLNAPAEGLAPQRLIAVSDLLRISSRTIPLGSDLHHQFCHYVVWLERLAADMMQQGVRCATQAFRVEVLVHTLLFSGFLRDAGTLADAVASGLRAMSPSGDFAQFFLDQISNTAALPKRSSLYNHRVTLHLGYCLARAIENDRLLEPGSAGSIAQPAGMLKPAVYILADSSPQGGIDWLQHTTLTIAGDALLTVFEAAQLLASNPFAVDQVCSSH